MNAFEYTIEELNKKSIKHAVHKFPSGVIMLDVWIGDLFYVFQFEETFIGLSEVNDENVGFDTMPDEKFYDYEEFKKKLELLLNQKNNVSS